MQRFSTASLVLRSLRHYWRSNAAVVAGVAVAAGVLTGSLLVGDSVRGSLRDIALERLGAVDYAVASGGFFAESLPDRLRAHEGFNEAVRLAVPALALDGAVKHISSETTAPRVSVLAVPDEFWRLAPGPVRELPDGAVILNRLLADRLGAKRGDALILTIGRRGDAPTDTTFGRRSREHTVVGLRVEVADVIGGPGLSRFSLRADQHPPSNLYVSLAWLQKQIGREGLVNVLLVSSAGADGGGRDVLPALREAMAGALTLEDYGLKLVAEEAGGYVALQSRRLVLPPRVVAAAEAVAGRRGLRAVRSSVYLANSLSVVREAGAAGPGVPYSVVAGLSAPEDGAPGLVRMADAGSAPRLVRDEILLNSWAAEDLGAGPGDRIRLNCFVRGAGGELRTIPQDFMLRGVVRQMTKDTAAVLVPDFEGITEVETMRDWDPPFRIEPKRIRARDEAYWHDYGPAPKAFLSPEAVRDFWLHGQPDSGTGAGWLTSMLFVLPESAGADTFASGLSKDLLRELPPDEFGLDFRPVRAQALARAEGATDFGVLFVSMSMFLVISAAALVGLLMRLAIERRAGHYGIMMATGFRSAAAARVLSAEGCLLTCIGVAAGVPLGLGYAWLIIYALQRWWRGAVAELALSLHVNGWSLAMGAGAGFLVSAAAMWWATRLLRRARAAELLAGWQALASEPRPRGGRKAAIAGVAALALGAALLVAAMFGVLPVTGAFFGGGAALLAGALSLVCARLQTTTRQVTDTRFSLRALAWRSASRNRLRSVLTVGLVAAASFVITTVAANRRDVTRLDTRERASGAGGFDLMATCDVPVHQNLSTPEGRNELGLPADSAPLRAARILSLRVNDGDDTSCLSMQRPETPRVLGVPAALMDRGGFSFVSVLRDVERPADEESSWRLLDAEAASPGGGPPVVPAFADAGSAQWILKVELGDEVPVTAPDGRQVRLRIVGLLATSIFQSELLISERHFRRHFGADSGYRYFLMETAPGDGEAVRQVLERKLSALGFSVRRTAVLLASYARVQNTYLATFQTLGGLGLLLGTFGVVAVLLRGVVERRGELAMMLALGLRRRKVVAMIVLENASLLLVGVFVGSLSALVAVAPHLASSLADVNWLHLTAVLCACVLVGLASCSVAAALSVRRGLLAALRSE